MCCYLKNECEVTTYSRHHQGKTELFSNFFVNAG